MNISTNYQAHASNGASSNTGSTSNTDSVSDTFLQLLVSQLKNQSPLDPVDPNQFVGQLVQFNTLNQIIGIRDLLEQFASVPINSTGSTPTQGGD